MVIFHARRALGHGSGGDGAQETEIGWNISLITILALLYPLAVPTKFVEREGFNFSIVCVVWALHCYIFYSRSKDNWGPSIIDNGVIYPEEWNVIIQTCFPSDDEDGLSARDHYFLNICAMIGSLGSSIVVIGRLVYLALEPVDFSAAISKLLHIRDVPKAWMALRRVVCLVVFPLITVTQFWAIVQIRRGKWRLAKHIGAEFVDDQWGFGQIVAVVVWVLVLTDYAYAYMFGK
jgi:hypothetical protein